MKIKFIACVLLLALAFLCALTAQNDYYTVVKGDSLWKIAVKYQVGLSEIIGANPQIQNSTPFIPEMPL